MCGIVGFSHTGGDQENLLRRMRDSLAHRGPDEAGSFCDQRVALGHRRLSIVDLKSGQQPMSDAGDRLVLVYNGEIYNHQELRKELGEELFKTDCDTEVLLYAYLRWGHECLSRLNGMFAFALYDKECGQLFIARDRMGQKPLYYTFDNQGELLFSSEAKALFCHPGATKKLSQQGLRSYLINDYLPVPLTIFEGVYKLAGGEYLVFDLATKGLTRNRYWQSDFCSTGKDSGAGAEQEFLDRLQNAVEKRLMADVPLGIFLSGGIDSSTIAALACRSRPAHQVKTFSISFAERSYDESDYAQYVARFLGTDHHVAAFSADTMLQLLPEALNTLDEPFADPSYLPTLLLSRFAREHVTVALGGDGADELFAGYPTFLPYQVTSAWQLPMPVVKSLAWCAERLPVCYDNLTFEYKLKRFVRGLAFPGFSRISAWQGSFTPAEVENLLQGDLPPEDKQEDYLNIFDYYQRTYLPENILYKVDRASMACSLEVRSPFLDVDFVEYANALPSRCKLKGFQGKKLFRKAVRTLLPEDIIRRPKKGFGIPLAQWFTGPLKDELQQVLCAQEIRRQGLFDWPLVEQLLTDLFERKRNTAKELWALYVFQKWHASEFGG